MSQVVVVIGGGPLSPLPSARSTTTPRSSPPTAASTTPSPPACDPVCCSAISTASRAHGKMWAYAHEVEIDEHPGRQGRHRHRAGAAPRRRRPMPPHLLVLGAAGDRFDHTLGTLAALGNPSLAEFETDATAPRRGGHLRASTPAGRSMSTCPWQSPSRCWRCTGPCRGVTLTGRALAADRRHARPVEHPRAQQRDNRSATRRRHRRRPHLGGPMKSVISVAGASPRRRPTLVAGCDAAPSASCRGAATGDACRLRLVPDQGHAAHHRARRVHRLHRHRGATS